MNEKYFTTSPIWHKKWEPGNPVSNSPASCYSCTDSVHRASMGQHNSCPNGLLLVHIAVLISTRCNNNFKELNGNGTLAYICQIKNICFKTSGHSKEIIRISTEFQLYGVVNEDETPRHKGTFISQYTQGKAFQKDPG